MARADTAAMEREIAVLQWWQGLRETSNACFMPLFLDQHRFLVLCGGGGSGKSIFAGRKVLERVTTEPGHRWLVCRKVARTLRQSCWLGRRGRDADAREIHREEGKKACEKEKQHLRRTCTYPSR